MASPLRSPPPSGSSNFMNPDFLGLPVLITAGIGLPLIIVFAAVRIYARAVVLKRWKLDDYIYFLSCAFGISIIAFLISIVLSGSDGYHAWDIKEDDMTKSSIISLLAFWITQGPMLWLLKLALFSFVLTIFGSVRWFKNCAWIGIIVTGLVFSTYTVVVTMSCGPRPDSDAQSYLKGLNRKECSSSSGANAIVSNITSIVNGISNLYLVLISYPLISDLALHRKQMRGVYLMHGLGFIICICSVMGVVYHIKSWQTNDITGNQIPIYATFILEIALSLVIPCMPSIWTVYRYVTVPDINDTTTIGTPNMKLLSGKSSPQMESRTTWRKTHLSIEDIPYRKSSSELPAHHSRMKALPTTPLPLPHTVPPSPKTPGSSRSMSLPIFFPPTSGPSVILP